MIAIYKRELSSYFTGIMGWLFLALITCCMGIMVSMQCLNYGYPYFEYCLYTSLSLIVLILAVSVLTMRSVAEERRQRTDQLLYSLPISTFSIMLGKYLAMLTVFAIACALMTPWPVILSQYGTVNYFGAYGSLLGYFFMGASLLAIGLFASSITENQVVAAVISFMMMMAFLVMSLLKDVVSSTAFTSLCAVAILVAIVAIIVGVMTKNYWFGLGIGALGIMIACGVYAIDHTLYEGLVIRIMENLSMFDRFSKFIFGSFDLTAIIYDITLVGLFLFLADQAFEKRRWS